MFSKKRKIGSNAETEALVKGCEDGNLEIVTQLLADSKVDYRSLSLALKAASFAGHIAIVKLLLLNEKVDLISGRMPRNSAH